MYGLGCDVMLYYMMVEDNVVLELIVELVEWVGYVVCLEVVVVFNVVYSVLKKGLVLMFVKFGISFIIMYLN